MNGANPTPAADTEIVSARIHPAIGIARVGNSEKAFYVGPEIPSPPPAVAEQRRDSQGALMREAARFRIYGYNQAGEVVRELTADSAHIEWQLSLANLKASWYQFQIALDIPEAATAPLSRLRNKNFGDRSKLAISSQLRTLTGAKAASVVLDGKFNDNPVYLGEAHTDEQGRLIVLGGRGKTGSLPGATITTFANNDGWHDDVSDGPVSATVRIGEREIPTDPAWIVTGPPNYAPDLKGVRTMYDLLRDIFIEAGSLTMPEVISFTGEILPIFQRMAGLQWVNAGYASAFGTGGTLDFLSPGVIAKCADASEENKAFRFEIFNAFRDFGKDSWSPVPWPWLYGDAMEIPFAQTPRQNTMLAKHQLLSLRSWAKGSFVSDLAGAKRESIDDYPVQERPAMLDRAALDFCLADAFHPGCEMTWPMRHTSMYMAPFRIRHRPPNEVSPPLGDTLSPGEALAVDGPLYGQQAGWITRWMAVPWHTDTASCRSQASYGPTYNPFVPTFWPARVPNQVLLNADYAIARDTSRPRQERIDAFRRRDDWMVLGLGNTDDFTQMKNMLHQYGDMSLILASPGVDGDPDLPSTMFVADREPQAPTAGLEGPEAALDIPTTFTERLGDFPRARRR